MATAASPFRCSSSYYDVEMASSTWMVAPRQARHAANLRHTFSTATTSEETTTPSSTTTTTATTTATTQDHDSLIQDGKKRVLACALQGDAVQAQQILDQLESLLLVTTTATTTSTDSSSSDSVTDSLLECREAVLDAWISHQLLLVNEYNETTAGGRRKRLRAQIFEAAQGAHQALEKTVPFLSKPAMAIYTQRSASSSSKRSSSSAEAEEASVGDHLDDPGVGVLGSPTTTASSSTKRRPSPEVMLHRCNAVLTAWARASKVTPSRQGIPQRATFLLQRMEASARRHHGSSSTAGSVKPSTDSYNRVLEAWAWSQEHLRATMAEQIFQNMSKQARSKSSSSSNNKTTKPNGESYRWIIHAWCQSKQKKSAFTATGHLMTLLRRLESRREDIEPTLDTYHMVMEAWTTAEDKNVPIKAMGMLRIMEYAESKKFCSVPVDETCYRYFLQAIAKRCVIPEQGPVADQILNKLKDKQIVPDGDCYGAAIRTWKNAALNPLFGASREHSVNRTVELLEEVSVAHQRSATRMIKPTTAHFNDVLEALSASYKAVSRDIASALVDVMENSISEENESAMSEIQPNSETYMWLLLVHVRSKKPDKVETAKQVLERVKANLATVAEDSEKLEVALVGVYNAFVQVCASAKTPQIEEGEKTSNSEVLQSALAAVEELRSLYGLRPNSETYSNLLEVCKTQLEVGSERSRITEDIFLSCCAEGLVDEKVLQALKGGASDEQYFELVISHSDSVEGTRMVPEEWTSNAGGNRVVTADGRKAVPLSVHGRYTITKAMKEYKMRKLRSKVNQRVLQGGRLKLDKKQMGKPIFFRLDEEAVA